MKPELNGLFREEDYPAAERLRTKFGLKVEILPVPIGADFRVQMSVEEQARVSREIDANVRESLTRGTEDLWRRVREAVAHMVDRLNESESRFHSSLVTNVLDIVEILPRLNVNGDADLNHFRDPASFEPLIMTKLKRAPRYEPPRKAARNLHSLPTCSASSLNTASSAINAQDGLQIALTKDGGLTKIRLVRAIRACN